MISKSFEQQLQKIRDIWNRVDGIKKNIPEIYKVNIGLSDNLYFKQPQKFILINKTLTYEGNVPSLPIDFDYDIELSNFPISLIPFSKIFAYYHTEEAQYWEIFNAPWGDSVAVYHYWNIIDDNKSILKILPVGATTLSLGDFPVYFTLMLIVDKPPINYVQADR